METKFNFNSQVCTSKIQSERLLALGLKKKTADMVWINHAMTEEYDDWKATPVEEWDEWNKYDIPAWSLHRLLCLYGGEFTIMEVFNKDGETYDDLISEIEEAIKEGYFNKDYLQEQAGSSREE